MSIGHVVEIDGKLYTGARITIEALRQLAQEIPGEAFRRIVRRAIAIGRLALIA